MKYPKRSQYKHAKQKKGQVLIFLSNLRMGPRARLSC